MYRLNEIEDTHWTRQMFNDCQERQLLYYRCAKYHQEKEYVKNDFNNFD